MSQMVVLLKEVPPQSELIDLYDAVGWGAYTDDPEHLMASVAGSSLVLTVREKASGQLIGLARTVSDGYAIAYIQDVLVRPSYQRAGVGTLLIREIQRRYSDIRQLVLITDAEARQRSFYESLEFAEVHDHDPELRAFVKLR